MFHARFYDHARCVRLRKLLCLGGFLEFPADVLNRFWIQVRPLRNRFGSKTVTNLQRSHATAIPQRKQESVRVQRSCAMTAVAVGQSQRVYSSVNMGIFSWCSAGAGACIISVPLPRGKGAHIE